MKKSLLALVMVLTILIAGCNSQPPLKEGQIVSKDFIPSHWEGGYQTQYTYHWGINPATGKAEYYTGPDQVWVGHDHIVSEAWRIQLEGDCKPKNDGEYKCRKSWIQVDETDYHSYKIGSHYPRGN